jgi:hypothetical protein
MCILDLHMLLSLCLVKSLSNRAGKQASMFAFKVRESVKLTHLHQASHSLDEGRRLLGPLSMPLAEKDAHDVFATALCWWRFLL